MKLTEIARRVRATFRPKLKEVSEACASCPFRTDNEKEWVATLCRLAEKQGVGPIDPNQPKVARRMVHVDVMYSGEFHCHSSVYNPDMSLRDPKHRRQCAGATRFYKTGKMVSQE